jgi:NADH pyrophosphatase NudC (nudix superfamily)
MSTAGGRASVQVRGFPDREVKDHILVYNRIAFDESGEEEAVRRLVTLMAAALLLSGAPAAEAAKSHRVAPWCEADGAPTLQQAVCRGWLRYCPRGYLTRCSPFRCWCVITQMNPACGDGAVAASVAPRICPAVAAVRQQSAMVAWSDSWPLRPAKGAGI